jgi:hypothetical protein
MWIEPMDSAPIWVVFGRPCHFVSFRLLRRMVRAKAIITWNILWTNLPANQIFAFRPVFLVKRFCFDRQDSLEFVI